MPKRELPPTDRRLRLDGRTDYRNFDRELAAMRRASEAEVDALRVPHRCAHPVCGLCGIMFVMRATGDD